MSLKNELQLEIEMNALAQPAVDAARYANAAAGAANSAAANANAILNDIDAAKDALVAEIAEAAREQQEEIQQKGEQTLASIPEDYTDLVRNVESLWDRKADAIIDTSERAASHTLHAQNGPLAVTMYGKTSEVGVGDKSPSNPHIIFGKDSAIHVGGRNLIDGAKEEVGDGQITYTFDKPLQAGKYTFSANISTDVSSADNSYIKFFGAENGMFDYGVSFKRQATRTEVQVSLPNPMKTMRIFASSVSGSAGHSLTVNEVQLEPGATASPYEPYNANVIDMPLLPDGDPLYGDGTIDDTIENDVLVNGERKCRVTRRWACLEFDGTEGWEEGTGSGYSFYYTNVKKAAVSQYRPVTSHTVPANVVFVNGTQFRAYMAMFETLADWTDFLKAQAAAGTPFTVLELLATPEVYMTDHHDLRKPDTLTTDTVTVTGSAETAVTYPCDTKSYIDRKFDALAAALIGG